MKMLRTRLQQFALVISLMVAPLTFHYIVNIQQHARHLSTADNGSGEMEAWAQKLCSGGSNDSWRGHDLVFVSGTFTNELLFVYSRGRYPWWHATWQIFLMSPHPLDMEASCTWDIGWEGGYRFWSWGKMGTVVDYGPWLISSLCAWGQGRRKGNGVGGICVLINDSHDTMLCVWRIEVVQVKMKYTGNIARVLYLDEDLYVYWDQTGVHGRRGRIAYNEIWRRRLRDSSQLSQFISAFSVIPIYIYSLLTFHQNLQPLHSPEVHNQKTSTPHYSLITHLPRRLPIVVC
jgi:hypothetical protein